MFDCLTKIFRSGGVRAIYKGLVPGLQRQMCFASVRIGLYDQVKGSYTKFFMGKQNPSGENFGIRILAGITTGGMAVLFAQPTDVVKVRMQAQKEGFVRYKGCVEAYVKIARTEGIRGLWKGTLPNMTRNAVVNASELVTYDYIKTSILKHQILKDGVPCHFLSAFGAGFITTIFASPIDVVKTRFMNSPPGEYKGVVNCATSMFRNEGFFAFYKGFWPSFTRLGSWNIVMFVTYEQFKKLFIIRKSSKDPKEIQ
ncbi:DgyrCDS2502 [Dimorphilus gyrociliatus]|nr:DgyrCDS2502 [Dimorphilus gyrociliatus]